MTQEFKKFYRVQFKVLYIKIWLNAYSSDLFIKRYKDMTECL